MTWSILNHQKALGNWGNSERNKSCKPKTKTELEVSKCLHKCAQLLYLQKMATLMGQIFRRNLVKQSYFMIYPSCSFVLWQNVITWKIYIYTFDNLFLNYFKNLRCFQMSFCFHLHICILRRWHRNEHLDVVTVHLLQHDCACQMYNMFP